jgi:hypothetical protein
MQKLPVDISSFAELRRLQYLYIDKTEYIYRMVTGGRRFFLSRPRRFGKSLLVSTLKELLAGHRELFEGLWIAQSDFPWEKHAVITLDFSMLLADNVETFRNRLQDELIRIAHNLNIFLEVKGNSPDIALKQLVYALHKEYGRVAILIDEYDSPIVRALDNPLLVTGIHNEIQHFFAIIKGLDAELQFVFITGVSSFAKAGLFSGINNLRIATLREEFAAICGYTDSEVDVHFSDYIALWANEEQISRTELRANIRHWYNGYHFGHHVTSVYNPFSLMNALESKSFKNFWFESGAPTFLIKQLRDQLRHHDYQMLIPEEIIASEESLGIFDIEKMPLTTLMFQTGYLTITDYEKKQRLYTLGYPNQEVKNALQTYFLEVFAHLGRRDADTLPYLLYLALNKGDIEQAVDLLKQLFAHIPYQLHIKEEKFYHALLQIACSAAGIKAQSEYSTSHGRIDLIMELPQCLYVAEIKFNSSASSALEQIDERRYYERFSSEQKPITLLGLAFHRKPQEFTITYAVKQL